MFGYVAGWCVVDLHFSANFKADCAVRRPSIPDPANARATSCCALIDAKSKDIKKGFPVPPGASRKYIPPVHLFTVLINESYAFFCC